MFPESFVDIVGFQLEKVHTGVIAWFLDHRNPHVGRTAQAEVLSRLLNVVLVEGDLQSVRCWRETKAGSRKLDLVTQVRLKDGREWNLAWEAKVDTDVIEGQLRDISRAFDWGMPEGRRYFLLLLGSAQETHQHQQLSGFDVVDVDRCLALFSPHAGCHPLLTQWVGSLVAERDRMACVCSRFAERDGDTRRLCEEFGYRDRPVYYALYGHLRRALESRSLGRWAIYSGTNNPVMNWWSGWLRLSPAGDWQPSEHQPEAFYARKDTRPVDGPWLLQLYWEFNFADFVLKAGYDQCPIGVWDKVLAELRAILGGTDEVPSRLGSRSMKAGAGWKSLTIAVWQFEFHKQPPAELASRVERILSSVHPRLEELGGHE